MEGGGRRRLTLWDQMSAVDGGVREVLTGLTLNDVLGTAEKPAAPAPPAPLARSQSAPGLQPQLSNLTLMDVIREQDPNARSSYEGLLGAHHNRDKKYWKNFKHKLSLKRAGANWTSSIRIPASDIPIRNTSAIGDSRSSRPLSFARVNSVRYPHSAESTQSDDNSSSSAVDRDHSSSSSSPPGIRPQISRLSSTRLHQSESTHPGDPDSSDAPPHSQLQSFGRQMSRHNSTRYLVTLRQNSMYNNDVADFAVTVDGDEEGNGDNDGTSQQATTRRLSVVLAEERSLSAREAVAAQEAAEAAAAAEREQTEAAESSESPAEQPPLRMSLMDLMDYNIADEEEEEAEEVEAEVVVEEEESESGGVEHKCCVCMVRHKGAAFIPCGHTFCRLCSRELMVGRGNCPLCNRFITEILDIF